MALDEDNEAEEYNENQSDRRDPTASRWGIPHSVTTSKIVVAASSGVSDPQFVNEMNKPSMKPAQQPGQKENFVDEIVKQEEEDLNEKRVIEAALFISGRELTLEELKVLTGIAAPGYLKKLLEELKDEYNKRESAIEVVEIEGRYTMRVRNRYIRRVKAFAQESEISKSALRTLAYISKHDGVLKSEVVKRIGTQVYQDVKELTEKDFIKQKKAGRSSKLMLTAKFKNYFATK